MAKINPKLIAGSIGGVMALAVPFIKEHEGNRRDAYLDPIGIPTICAGITRGVKLGDRYTPKQCDAATSAALLESVSIVQRCAPVVMNEAQLAAFTSFTYNVGPGGKGVKDGFCSLRDGRTPTMVKRLLAGDYDGACDAIGDWLKPYVNGKPLPGIVNRRKEEIALCKTKLPDTVTSYEIPN